MHGIFDPNYLCLAVINSSTGPDCPVQCLPIILRKTWNAASRQEVRSHHIRPCDGPVDLAHTPECCHFDRSNSTGIAVSFFRQSPHKNVLAYQCTGIDAVTPCDYVRVKSCAADVLSDLIYDQHIGLSEFEFCQLVLGNL